MQYTTFYFEVIKCWFCDFCNVTVESLVSVTVMRALRYSHMCQWGHKLMISYLNISTYREPLLLPLFSVGTWQQMWRPGLLPVVRKWKGGCGLHFQSAVTAHNVTIATIVKELISQILSYLNGRHLHPQRTDVSRFQFPSPVICSETINHVFPSPSWSSIYRHNNVSTLKSFQWQCEDADV